MIKDKKYCYEGMDEKLIKLNKHMDELKRCIHIIEYIVKDHTDGHDSEVYRSYTYQQEIYRILIETDFKDLIGDLEKERNKILDSYFIRQNNDCVLKDSWRSITSPDKDNW